MRFSTILFVFGFVIWTLGVLVAGYTAGREDTYREAYKNGLMIIERHNGKKVYRWIETHKIGYDYDE